jgi:hypothetical protein
MMLSRQLSNAEAEIDISQDAPLNMTALQADTQSLASDAAISASCPGYELKLPEGQSPYISYPFAIHSLRTLPWMILLGGETMTLMSDDCTWVTIMKNNEPFPCVSCRSLHNHTVVMGIQHCVLDGAHKNMPWSFLGIMQLVRLLDQKTSRLMVFACGA